MAECSHCTLNSYSGHAWRLLTNNCYLWSFMNYFTIPHGVLLILCEDNGIKVGHEYLQYSSAFPKCVTISQLKFTTEGQSLLSSSHRKMFLSTVWFWIRGSPRILGAAVHWEFSERLFLCQLLSCFWLRLNWKTSGLKHSIFQVKRNCLIPRVGICLEHFYGCEQGTGGAGCTQNGRPQSFPLRSWG